MGENRKKILKRIIISRKNVKKNHKKWRKTIELDLFCDKMWKK